MFRVPVVRNRPFIVYGRTAPYRCVVVCSCHACFHAPGSAGAERGSGDPVLNFGNLRRVVRTEGDTGCATQQAARLQNICDHACTWALVSRSARFHAPAAARVRERVAEPSIPARRARRGETGGAGDNFSYVLGTIHANFQQFWKKLLKKFNF